MKHKLYLASSSSSRKMLLDHCRIPFTVIPQAADEQQCDFTQPLEKIVSAIARQKMEHARVPGGKNEGEICFILTADTLVQDLDGTIQGKPVDHADAIAKLKSGRDGSFLSTAFCLEKREWQNGQWHLIKRIEKTVSATYRFAVPDEWINFYFANTHAMQCAGAATIESVGLQFLETVNGSFSTIIGLPMFEVRNALEEIGFFKK